MKRNNKKKSQRNDKTNFRTSRRVFIKQMGISYLIASGYSLISLSQFACSESVSPNDDFTPSSYQDPYPPYYYI